MTMPDIRTELKTIGAKDAINSPSYLKEQVIEQHERIRDLEEKLRLIDQANVGEFHNPEVGRILESVANSK